jgi:5-(carboxyamino)imidazole ribonucleotide mutase
VGQAAKGCQASALAGPSSKPMNIQIGVVMGSSSDWDTMQHAVQILQQFGITHEARVVSAHRMPDDMFAYAEAAWPGPAAPSLPALAARRTCRACWRPKPRCRCWACRWPARHLVGRGFAAQHCANAQGHAGGHLCHWRGGCRQCGAVCRGHAGGRPPQLRAKLDEFRAHQTEVARGMTVPPCYMSELWSPRSSVSRVAAPRGGEFTWGRPGGEL